MWEPKEKTLIIPSLEETRRLWQKNKVIPPHLEATFYEALAHYPELKETYLIVVETKFYGIQHTLRSYPPLLSLPNKRKDRVYPVVINTTKGIPNSFYDLTKEEQKGILVHELGHTLDYSQRTSFAIIGFTCNWLVKSFIPKLERAIDRTAISRGCGRELFHYRKNVIATTPPELAAYLKETYMGPEEIMKEAGLHEAIPVYSKHPNGQMRTMSKPRYFMTTAFSAIPAISQMMYLVWIKKMHKKPDWYKK